MMGLSVVYIAFLFTLTLWIVRNPRAIRLQPILLISFSPFAIGTLAYFILPAYWEATLGPLKGISDDGRGFGGALIFLVTFPTTLILNLVLYAARITDPANPNEVDQ
jgi:hypothetical protein